MKTLCVPLLLLVSINAQAMCYTVYDSSDKLLFRSTKTPVSLSGSLQEAVQQRFPGASMTITNENCPPYERVTSEAEERAKAVFAKRRKADEAEAARAAAE